MIHLLNLLLCSLALCRTLLHTATFSEYTKRLHCFELRILTGKKQPQVKLQHL